MGRARAKGLAATGASVVVSRRKPDLCAAVAEEISTSTGRDVLGLACHVGEWDAIPGFVDAVVERFGRIDVLINNAGIPPAGEGPAQIGLDIWDKEFSGAPEKGRAAGGEKVECLGGDGDEERKQKIDR